MRSHAKATSAGSTEGNGNGNGRGLFRRALVAVLALAAFFALAVASASAQQTHLLKGTIPTSGGLIFGVAFDQESETVYLSDIGNVAVYAYEADGTPAAHPQLTKADGTTPYPFAAPNFIAVDNSGGATQGYVYVADPAAATVLQFDAAGSATAQTPITAAAVPADGTAQAGGLPNVVNSGSLSPNGIAVAANSDVYVSDAANSVIDVFNSAGAFVRQLGAGQLSGPAWLALDPAANLYVSGGQGLVKFSPAGECLDSCTPIDPAAANGVATDAAGNVYVSKGSTVDEYDSSGALIGSFGGPMAKPPFGGLVGVTFGLAANATTGEVYVSDWTEGTRIFGPQATIPTAVTTTASPRPNAATLKGTVDPDGEAVSECEFEFGSSPAYGQSVPCVESEAEIGSGHGAVPVHADVSGLNVETVYFFRLAAGNAIGKAVVPGGSFTTTPWVSITPQAPSEETGHSITLNATVKDWSSPLIRCEFDYVTDASFQANGFTFKDLSTGGSVPCDPAAEAIPADDADHPVSVHLTGLVGNSTYHYRIKAANELGPKDVGLSFLEGLEFTTSQTPPRAVTFDAGDRQATAATLNASVNPSGFSTTYFFEYGPTAAYGSKVPVPAGVLGKGRLPLGVSQTITGLQPAATYHFRVVAANGVGTEVGEDKSFTTLDASGVPQRAYELISPANKQGNNVKPQLGFQSTPDGNVLSYVGIASLGGGVETAPLLPRYLAYRSDDGWVNKTSDPPQIGLPSEGENLGQVKATLGISQDGSKTVVLSRKKLTPDAIEGEWTVYLHDLYNDSYARIGSNPDPNSLVPESFTTYEVFLDGTPNFDHILLGGGTPLLPGAPPNVMYEFSNGELKIVSTDLAGSPVTPPGFKNTWHDEKKISDDGQRIIYAASEGRLYLRSGNETRLISLSRRVSDAGKPQPAELLGADHELRHIYFFSQELTDSSASNIIYLYRYDTSTDQLNELTEVAKPDEKFQLAFFQVSADGKSVFFVSTDNLAPGASGADQKIYAWHDNAVHFVAQLNREIDVGTPPTGYYWASANGRYFAFVAGSQDVVPGVNTKNPAQCSNNGGPGERGYCRMMYRYDVGTDTTICVSCTPGGQVPTGSVAVSPPFLDAGTHSFPRVVDTSGRVFFDSPDRLVTGDSNSSRDVSEYSDAYGLRLISTGHGSADSQLAEVSEDGRDVFFTTQDQLVREDFDNSIDVYDARIGGGIASQNAFTPPPCGGEDCRGQVIPPTPPPPGGSETTFGPGNESSSRKGRCAKGRHKQRVGGKSRCVKQKKQSKKKRANSSRRQGR